MRSEFLLDEDAISGREPVGEKGEQFEGCQAGVGGVDVGIRLNLRFGSTHLAGALRWFLRVRNALARPRHERKVPLLANGRPVPWVSGIFSLCTHCDDNPRPGGHCCNNNGWRTAMPKLPPSLWLQNYTTHRKKLHPVVIW
jgi:hypothetical protein